MSFSLLIGNVISLSAAVFTIKSSISSDYHQVYIFQTMQCLLLAAASIFFHSYAGLFSLLVCAYRNWLAANHLLTKRRTALCLILIAGIGLMISTPKPSDLIVITANLLYTSGMLFSKSLIAIKWNIIINLSLWMIYEAIIHDIPSFLTDTAALASTVYSLIKLSVQSHS